MNKENKNIHHPKDVCMKFQKDGLKNNILYRLHSKSFIILSVKKKTA